MLCNCSKNKMSISFSRCQMPSLCYFSRRKFQMPILCYLSGCKMPNANLCYFQDVKCQSCCIFQYANFVLFFKMPNAKLVMFQTFVLFFPRCGCIFQRKLYFFQTRKSTTFEPYPCCWYFYAKITRNVQLTRNGSI